MGNGSALEKYSKRVIPEDNKGGTLNYNPPTDVGGFPPPYSLSI